MPDALPRPAPPLPAAAYDELLVDLAEIEALVLALEEPMANLDEIVDELTDHFHHIERACAKSGLAEVRMPLFWLKSLLSLAARGLIPVSDEVIDVLVEPVNFMRRLLVLKAQGGPGDGASPAGPTPQPEAQAPPEARKEPEAKPEPRPAQPEKAEAAGARQGSIIKVDTAKLDHLVNTLGELVITHTLISQDENLARGVKMSQTLSRMEELIEQMHAQVMEVRMVPLKSTFSRLERLVREVAVLTGKKAVLRLTGGETEMDKSVTEALYDPMVHLLRNAVDHGLENPAERSAQGKPEAGIIGVGAYKTNGRVTIEVSDDGRGLDRARIERKGLSLGLIQPNRTYSDQEIFQLIMRPDFSTAETVSQVSGRGVGMDVVKSSLRDLGAKLSIDSQLGQGSTFRIDLPATRSTSDSIGEAMVVRTGGEVFVIPGKYVLEAAHPQKDHFATVMRQGRTMRLRGEYIPLLDLARVLECPAGRRADSPVVVVVSAHGRTKGLLVDELIGLETVVTRPLDRAVFKSVTCVSAMGLMGGMAGLVLDAESLLNRREPDEADEREPRLAAKG